ncbi:MAG: hypothetical protein HY784_12710 [Chloroflexi bacterium]|nr:hypothetical protein [Chloroflexota bacterium]
MNYYLAVLFWFHLLGIAIWVGASLLVPLVVLPTVQGLDPPVRPKFMEAFSRRSLPWISASIVVVVVTGILQTGRIFGFAYLLGINVLVIKIVVAALMIANGVYLGFGLSPKAAALTPAPGAPPSPEFLKTMRRLGMHSWIQAGMGVIVLLLVGLLTAPNI